MGKQAGGARFGLEPREEFRALEACAFFTEANGFYCDGAPNDRIHGLVHNTHGAAAEFADDLVSSGFCYRLHFASGRWLQKRLAKIPNLPGQTSPRQVRAKGLCFWT